MPSINMPIDYGCGVFDSSVKDKSDIFALGGPIMTMQVTAESPGDTGSVTIEVTCVEFEEGHAHTDADYNWQPFMTVSVGQSAKSDHSVFSFGRFVYSGKGRLSCSYSEQA